MGTDMRRFPLEHVLRLRPRQRHLARKICSAGDMASTAPAVITVAITGDVAEKNRICNVPITWQEQVSSIVDCFEAGARMVHVHVRDDDGKCTWDAARYAAVMQGVKQECPDMILQFSTGNYAPTYEDRSAMLDLRPEMASLTPGSVNFRATRPSKGTDLFTGRQYLNTHEDIDALAERMQKNGVKPDVAIFDLSMLYATHDLIHRGVIKEGDGPVRLMYVLGGHMALPAHRPVLEFLLSESERLFGREGFTWCGVGLGWNHDAVCRWTLELGGHPRTGFEDSMMTRRGKFAESNAELVHHVAGLCEEYDRPLATPQEAREILGLASTPSTHVATFAPPSPYDEPHESFSTSHASQRPRQYMVM